MPITPVKSAINEVHDQLFLDRAVGKYLSNVSTNLGLSRPLLGYSRDATWRALVRRLALDYRQVSNLFRDCLTILLGPQKTVYTVLAENAGSTDESITIRDQDRIPQVGTLVIDQGLTTNESILYLFNDPRNGLVTLKTQVTKTHTSISANAAGKMKQNVNLGGTTLSLFNSGEFPITGFPYTLIVAPGTSREEVTTLTGHNWTNNQLTISPALTKNQLGPQPTPIVSSLTSVAAGNTVIRIQDSSKFPVSGIVRLLKNDGLTTTSQIVEFTDNDLDTGTLFLKQALTYTFPSALPGTTVTLMTEGTTVALAQVQVKGVDWDLFVTDPERVKIYIPEALTRNRMQDAAWLHENGTISASSTVKTGGSAIGDKTLKLTAGGATSFPRSGVLQIDTGSNQEFIGYNRHDANSFTRLVANGIAGGAGNGATTAAQEWLPSQKRTHYLKDRWWMFYSDGVDLVQCSSDGGSWTVPTVLVAGCDSNSKFSILSDPLYSSSRLRLMVTDEATYLKYYWLDANSDGTITVVGNSGSAFTGVFKSISFTPSGRGFFVGYIGSDNCPYAGYAVYETSWSWFSGMPLQLSYTADSTWAVNVIRTEYNYDTTLVLYGRDGQAAQYKLYWSDRGNLPGEATPTWETPAQIGVLADSNIPTLSGLLTIDNYTVQDNQPVLLKNQSTGSQNGVWLAHSTAWTRPGPGTPWITGSHFGNVLMKIGFGDTYAGTVWYCSSVAPNDVVGSSTLAFTQITNYGVATGVTLAAGKQLSLANGESWTSADLAFHSSAHDLVHQRFTFNAAYLIGTYHNPLSCYVGGTWGSATTIQSGVDTNSAPTLMLDSLASRLFCFWGMDNDHIYYNIRSSGAWTTTVDWLDTSSQPLALTSAVSIPDVSAGNFGVMFLISGAVRLVIFGSGGSGGVYAGTSILHVDCARALSEFDWYNKFKKLYLGRGTANTEIVTYSEINTANNTVTLALPTTVLHASQDPVHPFDWPDTLYLDRPLEKAHLAGVAVVYYRPVWPATTLHDGRILTSTDYLFQGSCLVDYGQPIPRSASTTLAEALAAPVQLQATQIPGCRCLEVPDASQFEATGEFNVHIRGGGEDQVVGTVGTVLQSSVTGLTLSVGASIGDLSVSITDATSLPRPSAETYGYRLLIDGGTANAEVVLVQSVNVGSSPNVVYLMGSLTENHSSGATVELMADVIILEDPLVYEFPGKVPKLKLREVCPSDLTPYARVTWVREQRHYIKVAAITGFTSGEDKVLVSFGYSTQELLEYNGTSSTPSPRLLFPDGVEVDYDHAIGEVVHLSGITNKTQKDGNDRVFYLPASVEERLQFIFDRGRAAGVKITVVNTR